MTIFIFAVILGITLPFWTAFWIVCLCIIMSLLPLYAETILVCLAGIIFGKIITYAFVVGAAKTIIRIRRKRYGTS